MSYTNRAADHGRETHQIVRVGDLEHAGSVLWRCSCGADADGYDDVAEARLAAAEHQLPTSVQQQVSEYMPDVDAWRDAVHREAVAVAQGGAASWGWWHTTADGTDFDMEMAR